ncbi:MAG TPA: hypothetical protein PKD86_15270 [Gemmatales bacterium]|nr:hypothetical protein [Gemmatales bacterium]HMP60704.1 hypothetical protein [Gemmatales bacterium]
MAGKTSSLTTIFMVSVLGLFLELMLIRWISTELRVFAYLQNTVLVVCFLGLGMGCWTCRQAVRSHEFLLPLGIIVLLLAIPYTRSWLATLTVVFTLLQDYMIWDEIHQQAPLVNAAMIGLGLLATLLLMLVVWETFVPLGRILGRSLEDHPRPIVAYSINIAGSLAGILLFTGVSACWAPPWVWLSVAAAVSLVFIDWHHPWQLGLLAGLIALAWAADLTPTVRKQPDGTPIANFTHAEALVWSPYQKLHLRRHDYPEPTGTHSRWYLLVNDTPYMELVDLSPEATDRFPQLFEPAQRGCSQYDVPLRLRPKPRKMLVVGSGGGNDLAAGLRHGAEEIVAIEIDPAILDLGRRFHPEQPYSSPRVRVVNDDARAFFSKTTERFDLIIFGLLDSHTTTSMTNSRLDHYVYTRESFELAKQLLAPGGIAVLSFEASKPFITDRIDRVLREVFTQQPLTFRVPTNGYGFGGSMFVVGDVTAARRHLDLDEQLRGLVDQWQRAFPLEMPGTTRICTDDWPYIYLQSPRVPMLHGLLAGLMLILFVVAWRRLRTPGLFAGWSSGHAHFFLLGAAFMLLETQNISKAAVVLGNTWEVNAIIIASILLIILAANLVAALLPRLPLLPVHFLLVGSCLGLYFVDLAWFAGLDYAPRAAVVGLVTSLPLFFSGIVFIRSFAVVAGKDSALGANLLGALVGGLLQSLTFWLGIQALLLIVAGLYALALWWRPSSGTER